MVSLLQDFDMVEGNSFIITVTVTTAAGAVVNLTDGHVTWTLRRSSNDNLAAITKGNTSPLTGVTLTDPTQGEFEIALLPADTKGLEGDYYHEAVFTDAVGNVSTLFCGTVTITRSVYA